MHKRSKGVLDYAEEDLKAADALSFLPRQAVYHLSQAVEKMLKAILLWDGIPFQATSHDLSSLSQLLPPEHALKVPFLKLASLDRYATSFRYPNPEGRLPVAPNASELAEKLSDAKILFAKSRSHCTA